MTPPRAWIVTLPWPSSTERVPSPALRLATPGNREAEREQRKEEKGLPHHAPSIGTQRVPRVIFM